MLLLADSANGSEGMSDTINESSSLADALARITRSGMQEFDIAPFLTEVAERRAVGETSLVAHCHHVALDGSGLPRLQDFTDYICDWVVEYVTPRKTLLQSRSANETETRLKQQRLRREAKEIFKQRGMSGEQGEILLFILAEVFLKLPQLLCKMSLKTDPEMHFHGLDGIHCGPGERPDALAVYWCESKIHKDIDGALSEALEGLVPFLVSPGAGGRDKRRELALLHRYMDLGDENLQRHVLRSLNPNLVEFNSVSWRGICLVGFDFEYPTEPNKTKSQIFLEEIEAKIDVWIKKISNRAENRILSSFEIHVLLIPLSSCAEFRECMRRSLGFQS
jgi:hypothetical protein